MIGFAWARFGPASNYKTRFEVACNDVCSSLQYCRYNRTDVVNSKSRSLLKFILSSQIFGINV
jgi:hypothetical protein